LAEPSKLAQAATLLTCNLEVLHSILDENTILNYDFRDFPQFSGSFRDVS
jgi:hypothetical protein